MKTKEKKFEYLRHDLDYTYPDKSDEHMITVKKLRTVNFDANYPYLRRGWFYAFLRGVLFVLFNLIVYPLILLTHGLKIYGKENLKKHKKILKNGAITISNHVFMWDYICVSKAIRPHIPYFPAWKTNIEGPNGPLIRWAGGLPIPTGNLRAMMKFSRDMDEVFQSKKWVHFFPEGSMWFFYPDIRPLKKGVFKYAVKYDRPIIPITMSFRKRKGLLKLFGKGPCVDLHVGEVMFVDKTLSPTDAETKLHKDAYHIMQVMNGINPGDPTYNTNQNIDEYKKTMC